jgi:NitT/TauT family transport system permease protein
LVSSGRFNGMVGLPLVFTALLHEPHKVMVALLVYGTGVFTVLSLVKMIDSIPKELFDHSRTLRMSEWRVVWEVVILGRVDEVIDLIRVNVAMLWMMLPMVESRFKFQGGIGALMEVDAKQFDYSSVFCALFVILFVGLCQDYVIGVFKRIMCPYAFIGMERS